MHVSPFLDPSSCERVACEASCPWTREKHRGKKHKTMLSSSVCVARDTEATYGSWPSDTNRCREWVRGEAAAKLRERNNRVFSFRKLQKKHLTIHVDTEYSRFIHSLCTRSLDTLTCGASQSPKPQRSGLSPGRPRVDCLPSGLGRYRYRQCCLAPAGRSWTRYRSSPPSTVAMTSWHDRSRWPTKEDVGGDANVTSGLHKLL